MSHVPRYRSQKFFKFFFIIYIPRFLRFFFRFQIPFSKLDIYFVHFSKGKRLYDFSILKISDQTIMLSIVFYGFSVCDCNFFVIFRNYFLGTIYMDDDFVHLDDVPVHLNDDPVHLYKSYFCENCDFKTNLTHHYNRHLQSLKHIRNCQETPYKCACGKTYVYRQGLSKHKKTCNFTKEEEQEITQKESNVVKELIKQNQFMFLENKEFKKMLLELAMKPTTSNSNSHHNHTNSHNKQFNIQVYLNETCKDAMNLSEFVDSLVIKASELEDMGKLGYAQGISNIIIRGLNELDETQRPLHCTDKKRETIYIKENNVWEKETMGRLLLRKMIRDIAHRNFKRMPQWMLDNPACDDIRSKKHIEYMSIVNQVMTGLGPEDDNGINKIIRNVANYTYIDKCIA